MIELRPAREHAFAFVVKNPCPDTGPSAGHNGVNPWLLELDDVCLDRNSAGLKGGLRPAWREVIVAAIDSALSKSSTGTLCPSHKKNVDFPPLTGSVDRLAKTFSSSWAWAMVVTTIAPTTEATKEHRKVTSYPLKKNNAAAPRQRCLIDPQRDLCGMDRVNADCCSPTTLPPPLLVWLSFSCAFSSKRMVLLVPSVFDEMLRS